jgi:hypothetical protein
MLQHVKNILRVGVDRARNFLRGLPVPPESFPGHRNWSNRVALFPLPPRLMVGAMLTSVP